MPTFRSTASELGKGNEGNNLHLTVDLFAIDLFSGARCEQRKKVVMEYWGVEECT